MQKASTYHSTAAEAQLYIVPDHSCRHVRRVQPGRRPAAAVPREEGGKLVRTIRRHCHSLRKTKVPLRISK